MNKTILITGGAGFIGSHAIKYFVRYYPDYHIVNLDNLTYAGNLSNLKEIEDLPNYTFLKEDIVNTEAIIKIFEDYNISHVIHLAAESHVDRSIHNPSEFILTNVIGTLNLLQAAQKSWATDKDHLFYHISTDEVYGSLGDLGQFTEQSPYDPRSPYSASKASSDHLVRAFYHTYSLPIVISNCSNNYGPYQFPEKLIPLMIRNIIHEKSLPVYGKGQNVRDWLFVDDHVNAMDKIFHRGRVGETYNIGGNSEKMNIELVHLLCDIMDEKLNRHKGQARDLITFIKDRPGHDLRYAINAEKIKNELGWVPEMELEIGLSITADWYINHREWLSEVTSGNYQKYYENHYTR
ncbi:MAG: dTDP-glucose 4,6-dehydratase [Bacteroidota bacterium]|nr:dTDP-glucose 4,6-dehydratase [Bacteroidota bacterium]